MTTVTINGISIDPTAPKPVLASLSLDNATAKASDYLIVQTKEPLDKAKRVMLTKAGAKILEAVPGDAYVCYFPKTDLSKVRALPFVAWAGDATARQPAATSSPASFLMWSSRNRGAAAS